MTDMFRAFRANAGFALPPTAQDFIDDFVDNFEFGLAFELLVYSIRENRKPIVASDYDRIDRMGKMMKMDPINWEDLAPGRSHE
jgi:hypothetical protein